MTCGLFPEKMVYSRTSCKQETEGFGATVEHTTDVPGSAKTTEPSSGGTAQA